MSKVRIGYFIPEFPGQTHVFFWRERKVLSELGVQADWLSTRCPSQGTISHIWASEAQQKTLYLVPLTISDWFNSLTEILRAGPFRWINCLSVIFLSSDTGLLEKVKLLALVIFSGKLIWLWKKYNWDHIHVHSCGNAANITLLASVLSELTYSITLHGPTLETYGNNQKQKWKHSTFALVVSDKLLNDVSVKLKGFLPKTVISIPMGVNLSEISRKSQYTPWEEGKKCQLFACGRLNPVKGHSFLFKSVEILRSRGIDTFLKIAGEDEQGGQGYHKHLEELIQEMNLAGCIELLGAVSQERIRSELENSHIFALASHNEGIPVAVMEAMAMEIPVVATNVGGNSELIESGKDGILVPDKNPEAMADSIELILKNPKLAQQLSQLSRQKVEAEFHDRRSAEALLEYANKLLKI